MAFLRVRGLLDCIINANSEVESMETDPRAELETKERQRAIENVFQEMKRTGKADTMDMTVMTKHIFERGIGACNYP